MACREGSCEFFDSDEEKTENERSDSDKLGCIAHTLVQAYTLVCCDAPDRVKTCLSYHRLICPPVTAEVFRLQSKWVGSSPATQGEKRPEISITIYDDEECRIFESWDASGAVRGAR